MKLVLVFLITAYQRTLSPDHGFLRARFPYGYCRFYPTCSEYAKTAIEKHGVVYGFKLTALRLFRCHPWREPSIDHVPRV